MTMLKWRIAPLDNTHSFKIHVDRHKTWDIICDTCTLSVKNIPSIYKQTLKMYTYAIYELLIG